MIRNLMLFAAVLLSVALTRQADLMRWGRCPCGYGEFTVCKPCPLPPPPPPPPKPKPRPPMIPAHVVAR